MTQAERIIEKFGGLSALARALGHKHVTTVQGWNERGYIPARQQADVLKAAERENIDLTPADFFESPDGDSALQEAS